MPASWRAGDYAKLHEICFGDDAAQVATAAQWTEWKIPLSSFTRVNRAKVTMLIPGLGDRTAPKKGGAGLLFIDDIRVTRP